MLLFLMEFTVFSHLKTIVLTFAKIIAMFVIQYFSINQAYGFFDLHFLLKL